MYWLIGYNKITEQVERFVASSRRMPILADLGKYNQDEIDVIEAANPDFPIDRDRKVVIENGELVGTTFNPIPVVLTDEELYQEQLVAEFNSAHELAILALKNWASLTRDQKDKLLTGLVKWALWKDGWLKLNVV